MTTLDKLKKAYELQKEVNSCVDATEMTQAKLLDAFVVEVFEFWNTLETFKWWKKNKNKSRELALEELADAFAFAILLDAYYFDNESLNIVKEDDYGEISRKEVEEYKNMLEQSEGIFKVITNDCVSGRYATLLILMLADIYFTLDELFEAHAKKSQVNIERQKNNY